MAAYRHLKRIAVVQTLFEWEFYKEENDPKKELVYAYQETMSFARDKSKEVAGQEMKHETYDPDEWTVGLLQGITENIEPIRGFLTKYAPEWPLPKIAAVDRAILYLGIYELLFSDETPEVVAINEAVEIAKSYGGPNSSKFVNGVLNSIYKTECKPEDEKNDKK